MTRTKMTAEEFSKNEIPVFQAATDKNTISLLEAIVYASGQCDRSDLSSIASQVIQLISNFRLHPGAAAELISTLSHSTYEALVEFENK